MNRTQLEHIIRASTGNADATDFFITVITPQEITQGWLAAINRETAGPKQVFMYRRFLHSLRYEIH